MIWEHIGSDMSGNSRPVGPTPRDRAVAVARAVAGMVPVAGPLLAELITEVVPGQRQERVEDWLRHLAERLAKLEEKDLHARLREPENVALFEEGAHQAARSVSEERRRHLAMLVADGIAAARRDYLESHRVLRLLGELDDAEVILLAGHLRKNRHSDYWDRHGDVMRGLAVHMGSSREEIDLSAVRKAGQQHLLRLGLLEERSRGRSTTLEITSLGRLVLRRVGLAAVDDL